MTCLNYKFDNLNLVNFGLMMAKTLNTEVAIEDPLWKGDSGVSSMMIISPVQTYRQAYFYQDNEGANIMKSYKKEGENISQVIQELDRE